MTNWGIIIGVGVAVLVCAVAAFALVAWWPKRHRQARVNEPKSKPAAKSDAAAVPTQSLEKLADEQAAHIFDDAFREELRNRGRLHFEKIIGENAMFLQQDLRLTTSQLNDYMKTEITKKLREEFEKYEQSIDDAKQLAMDAIQKTNDAVDEQRRLLSSQVQKEFAEAKARTLRQFEDNMAEVINHYLLAAIGNEIDLSGQLEFILSDLEANKAAIIEDIKHGT